MNNNNTVASLKVAVGLSGGVDSAVSAWLLKRQGYQVLGVYLKLWTGGDLDLQNKFNKEEEKAKSIAQQLGVDFMTLDVQAEFKKHIVDNFIANYVSGGTPNPCVRCNQFIKFGVFYNKMIEFGQDYIAMGHYVRVTKQDGQYVLLQAKDLTKDQSYFLYTLKQQQLSKVLFPLGDYMKSEVMVLAKQIGLSIIDSQESQEICFIKEKYYKDFLKKMHVELTTGKICTATGEELGQHQGLPLYTLGQRRDIGIGGRGPYYVIGFDYVQNQLIVGHKQDVLVTQCIVFTLQSLHWVSGDLPKSSLTVSVKVRYRMQSIVGEIYLEDNVWQVKVFANPTLVTRGQSAVFYQDDVLLGGGVIVDIMTKFV